MMSPSAVRVFPVLYCCMMAFCNADITAYIRDYLVSTTCVSVPKIKDVCNIDWKVREDDAKLYDDVIESINATISSSVFYEGLSIGDATHCRKMYENMMCRNAFPVCDMKRMLVDYGDATTRCKDARSACTTIAIEGCEYGNNGVQDIVSTQDKCQNIAANTSQLCPGVQLKVPNRNNVFVKPIVEDLLKTAEKFSQELKNHTVTVGCEKKYREVLCRLIDACSPDGFYYLHYISLSECEEMISCVKSAGFSDEITSVCSKVPSTEDTENITVPNPYVRAEIRTTAVPTTSERTTKDQTTSERTMKGSPSPTHDNPTLKDVPTSETLEEPKDENKNTNQVASNNTKITKQKKSNTRGNASRNYQNLYLLVMVLTLLI